jgi:hypothetical protein
VPVRVCAQWLRFCNGAAGGLFGLTSGCRPLPSFEIAVEYDWGASGILRGTLMLVPDSALQTGVLRADVSRVMARRVHLSNT